MSLEILLNNFQQLLLQITKSAKNHVPRPANPQVERIVANPQVKRLAANPEVEKIAANHQVKRIAVNPQVEKIAALQRTVAQPRVPKQPKFKINSCMQKKRNITIKL